MLNFNTAFHFDFYWNGSDFMLSKWILSVKLQTASTKIRSTSTNLWCEFMEEYSEQAMCTAQQHECKTCNDDYIFLSVLYFVDVLMTFESVCKVKVEMCHLANTDAFHLKHQHKSTKKKEKKTTTIHVYEMATVRLLASLSSRNILYATYDLMHWENAVCVFLSFLLTFHDQKMNNNALATETKCGKMTHK